MQGIFSKKKSLTKQDVYSCYCVLKKKQEQFYYTICLCVVIFKKQKGRNTYVVLSPHSRMAHKHDLRLGSLGSRQTPFHLQHLRKQHVRVAKVRRWHLVARTL